LKFWNFFELLYSAHPHFLKGTTSWTLWHRGTVAMWHRGTVAPWQCGTVAMWHQYLETDFIKDLHQFLA
jgi:hypothetical protein